MRAKSTRIILLTDYPEVEHPGGIIEPGAASITRRGQSARTMLWNMQDDSEVEGTVEINRSILWDVQEESGPELTNYVEFPFFQFLRWRADGANPGSAYGLKYRGTVRVWESGTIQMVGELLFVDGTPTTSLSTLSYKLNFIETGQPGSLQTVATIPAVGGVWNAVDWAGRPGGLQHCEVYYGGIPISIAADHTSVELFQYSAGLVLPPDPPHIWGGSAGGVGITACGLVRDGNDIDGEWAIGGGPFTTQHYIATCHQDSTTLDAVQGYAVSNCIAHLNASTLFGSLAGTFTRTIPDSPTTGLRIQIWTAHQNVNTGTFDCGPWFRLAYAPTIQQGIDPIP